LAAASTQHYIIFRNVEILPEKKEGKVQICNQKNCEGKFIGSSKIFVEMKISKLIN
jgi:hypothetical protein